MSGEKEKRTPQERLAEALAEARADQEMERLEKMSDEAIAKELADDGVDMEEEHRHVAALLAKHGVEVDAAKPKVVPLAARRGRTPWVPLLAAAAVAVVAIGYAWKTSRPRPEDDMANNPRSPVAPPSTAPPSPMPDLDIHGNPTPETTDSLVAHPPPRPCKPVGSGYVKLAGTVSREGARFVLVPDDPVCGATTEPVEALDLEPANPKVGLPRFGVEHIAVEGRIAARDGGGLVVRVDRASPR